MTRLEQLLNFYEEDRLDPFNLYALALEYLKYDVTKAVTCFDQLLKDFPDYVPTYYHAGKLYQELEKNDQSLKIFQEGIEKARIQNDKKALRELQAAYLELSLDM